MALTAVNVAVSTACYHVGRTRGQNAGQGGAAFTCRNQCFWMNYLHFNGLVGMTGVMTDMERRGNSRHKSFCRGRVYFNNRRSSVDCPSYARSATTARD